METKQMIEVMQAFEDGKKIECRTLGTKGTWDRASLPCWNWERYDYRIAPEPKKEGRWERVEISEEDGQYSLIHPVGDIFVIDVLPRIPGFGGIDYRSPFDPKIIVRSMVPVMFDPPGGAMTAGFDESYRPGIPVAAWFWKEE